MEKPWSWAETSLIALDIFIFNITEYESDDIIMISVYWLALYARY
jgi:hypothetical protein